MDEFGPFFKKFCRQQGFTLVKGELFDDAGGWMKLEKSDMFVAVKGGITLIGEDPDDNRVFVIVGADKAQAKALRKAWDDCIDDDSDDEDEE